MKRCEEDRLKFIKQNNFSSIIKIQNFMVVEMHLEKTNFTPKKKKEKGLHSGKYKIMQYGNKVEKNMQGKKQQLCPILQIDFYWSFSLLSCPLQGPEFVKYVSGLHDIYAKIYITQVACFQNCSVILILTYLRLYGGN